MKKKYPGNPRKAIKDFCADRCPRGPSYTAWNCVDDCCPLYPYRLSAAGLRILADYHRAEKELGPLVEAKIKEIRAKREAYERLYACGSEEDRT